MKILLTCSDFHKAGFTNNECCVSCHEDEWEGYSDLIEEEASNSKKTKALICCNVCRCIKEFTRDIFAKVLKEYHRKLNDLS